MRAYLVTYDLLAPGRDYSRLHEAIKAFHSWCRPVESVWIIKSPGPASAIRDRLVPHIDANDRLLVSRLHGEAAWFGLTPTVSEWLRNNCTLD